MSKQMSSIPENMRTCLETCTLHDKLTKKDYIHRDYEA